MHVNFIPNMRRVVDAFRGCPTNKILPRRVVLCFHDQYAKPETLNPKPYSSEKVLGQLFLLFDEGVQ